MQDCKVARMQGLTQSFRKIRLYILRFPKNVLSLQSDGKSEY